MTNEQAKKMLKAKLECLKRKTSGTYFDCNLYNCDECSLNYEQGNMGEQKEALEMAIKALEEVINGLPPAQQDENKYEYHYDHTDCIWYRPEARNRCPATCAQYRDGWNDAMNYIFRDGEGYRPFRRDKKYEG